MLNNRSITCPDKLHPKNLYFVVLVLLASLVQAEVHVNASPGFALADPLGSIIGSRFHFHLDKFWEFQTAESEDPLVMCHVTLKYFSDRPFFLVFGGNAHRGNKVKKDDLLLFVDKDKPLSFLDLRVPRFPETEDEQKLLGFCELGFNSKDLDEIKKMMKENWTLFQVQPSAEVGRGLNSFEMARVHEDDFDFEFFGVLNNNLSIFRLKRFYRDVPLHHDDLQEGQMQKALKQEVSRRLSQFKGTQLKGIIDLFKAETQGYSDILQSQEAESQNKTTTDSIKSPSDASKEDLKNLQFVDSLPKFFDTYLEQFNPNIFEEDTLDFFEECIELASDAVVDLSFKSIFKKTSLTGGDLDFLIQMALLQGDQPDPKRLRPRELYQFVRRGIKQVYQKSIETKIKTTIEERTIDPVMLSDEMVARVLKKYSNSTSETLELAEMQSLAYWTGEDAGMTVEKVLYLLDYELQRLFDMDLLVDLIYSFLEKPINQVTELTSAGVLDTSKYWTLGLLKRVKDKVMLNVPLLMKHLTIWGEVKELSLLQRVSIPMFTWVDLEESKDE